MLRGLYPYLDRECEPMALGLSSDSGILCISSSIATEPFDFSREIYALLKRIGSDTYSCRSALLVRYRALETPGLRYLCQRYPRGTKSCMYVHG
jgi:hypothetical protein